MVGGGGRERGREGGILHAIDEFKGLETRLVAQSTSRSGFDS